MDVIEQKWAGLYQHSIAPHYLQSWEWYLQPVKVLITESASDGIPVAGSRLLRIPVVGGKFAHYKVPRGPIFSGIDALRQHLAELCEWLPADALTLSVSPYFYADDPLCNEIDCGLREAGFESIVAADHSYYQTTPRISLAEELAVIMARYRPAFRRQLAKAEKAGIRVEVRQDKNALLNYVEGHSAANLARGAPAPDEALIEAWHKQLASSPESMRLSFAVWKDCNIAGQISMRCGEIEVYEWGYSNPDPQFAGLPKSHLLHHQTLVHAKESGCLFYDLGGYWRGEGNTNSINRFKSMMSGELVDMLPPYQFVRRPLINSSLKIARKIRANYL